MERTRTTEHTNSRSKQRSKEQSSSSQSRPNVRIKIPNIHNSSGNNKRKKEEEKETEQVCMYSLLSPNPKFRDKETIRGFRLLELLPPPRPSNQRQQPWPYLVVAEAAASPPFPSVSSRKWKPDKDGEQTEGRFGQIRGGFI